MGIVIYPTDFGIVSGPPAGGEEKRTKTEKPYLVWCKR
jgi:hypothetical protein